MSSEEGAAFERGNKRRFLSSLLLLLLLVYRGSVEEGCFQQVGSRQVLNVQAGIKAPSSIQWLPVAPQREQEELSHVRGMGSTAQTQVGSG